MKTQASLLNQCHTDPNVIIKHFGRKIRAARESRKLTQEQLAQMTGLDKITIIRYEKGEGSQLYLLNAYVIALALGVGLDTLLPAPELTPKQMLQNLKTSFDVSSEEILKVM